MNKIHYTDFDLVQDIDKIAENYLIDNDRPDYILGLVRGGLVPAVYLSHKFDVPMLTGRLSLRDHKSIDWSSFATTFTVLDEGKTVLVVDDMTDSGDTLNLLFDKCRFPNLKSAVLIHNLDQDSHTPDYYGRTIDKSACDQWIVFPWEQDNE